MPIEDVNNIDMQRLLTDPIYSSDIIHHGLTRLQWAAMRLVVELETRKEVPNETEVILLQHFMQESTSDMALNATIKNNMENIQNDLLKMIPVKHVLPKIEDYQSRVQYLQAFQIAMNKISMQNSRVNILVKAIVEYTYRTRHIAEITTISEKVHALQDLIERKESIPDSLKLTLREFGILRDIAELDAFYERYSSTLAAVNDNVLPAGEVKVFRKFYSAMEEIYHKKVIIPVGTHAYRTVSKLNQLLGRSGTSFYDYYRNTVQDNIHLSVITGVHKDLKESHLSGKGYHEQDFDFKNYLFNDLYQLRLEAFLAPGVKELFEKKFPDLSLIQILNYQYKLIEQYLYVNQRDQYAGIVLKKTFPNTYLLAHFTGEKFYDLLMRAGASQRAFNEAYKFDDCEMICSEFVARTTLRSIELLNEHLRKMLDLPPGERALINPLADKNLVDISPDRFLGFLQSNNLVVEVPFSNALAAFISPSPGVP